MFGWTWAGRKGESENVDIDLYTHVDFPNLVSILWDVVEGRALEAVTEVGHEAALVHLGAYREDALRRTAAEHRAYVVATTFHRLRADHVRATYEQASQPHHVATVAVGTDDALRRVAHGIHEDSFREHFGFVPRTYDKWLQDKASQSTFDWSQLVVAFVDGEPAAMLAGTDQFVSDENCGYVQTLGTLPAYRSRGARLVPTAQPLPP